MGATLPKRLEPFSVPGGFKGQLSELRLPDLLQHLRASEATGILSLVSGGARKGLYVKEGRVVFASSNLPNDRLGELLIREGKITVEEYDASIKAISTGKRQGRVLVEMGALSPKDLWEGVQFQVREIVYSIFQWDDGQFHFEESSLPDKERITVDLDIRDLISVAAPQDRCWEFHPGTVCGRGHAVRESGRAGGLGSRAVRTARAEPGRRRTQRARDLPGERDRGQREPEGPLRAPLHGTGARQGPEGLRPRSGLRSGGQHP